MPSTPPSGRQVEIRHGRQRAVVVEVGGGLREYEVDGQPVLEEPDESIELEWGLTAYS